MAPLSAVDGCNRTSCASEASSEYISAHTTALRLVNPEQAQGFV